MSSSERVPYRAWEKILHNYFDLGFDSFLILFLLKSLKWIFVFHYQSQF